MASMNFVDIAGRGYLFVWQQRMVLARLAVLPIAVKMGCYAAILVLGLQTDFLRQGLMIMPAYFLEGWLMAHAIRLALYGERWDEDAVLLRDPGRRAIVLAATVVYTIIKLIITCIDALTRSVESTSYAAKPIEPTFGVYITIMMVIMFTLWLFRFFWLYVPVAMDLPLKPYLRRTQSMLWSFYLLAVWLVCAAPASIILGGIERLFNSSGDPNTSIPYLYIMSCLQGSVETIITLIASVSIAYAIQILVLDKKRESRLF